MSNSHLIWIFRAFPAHQTATFLTVLAPTIPHSGVVRLPTWCRTNWISVCRASLHRVTAPNGALRLLLFHAYYFCASICQRTILQSDLSNSHLTQDCRCPNDLLYKVCGLTFASSERIYQKELKRAWLRRDSDPSTLVLGKRCSIHWATQPVGVKISKNTPYLPL